MATVTGMTAAAMQAILDGTVESAAVVGNDLILTLHDGTPVNAGNVRGDQGIPGPPGDIGTGSPAGGDLAGSTYPNPVIAANAVTDAKVAAANKDGLAATPSMRTLGAGAQQAAAGNHVHSASQITSGNFAISRLPAAADGEADPDKLMRSDDSRIPDYASLGLKIKTGSVAIPIASGQFTGTAVVNFTGTPFDGLPYVALTVVDASSTNYVCAVHALSATSLTARATHMQQVAFATNITCHWIAIGV
jgi:hypothetical protein